VQAGDEAVRALEESTQTKQEAWNHAQDAFEKELSSRALALEKVRVTRTHAHNTDTDSAQLKQASETITLLTEETKCDKSLLEERRLRVDLLENEICASQKAQSDELYRRGVMGLRRILLGFIRRKKAESSRKVIGNMRLGVKLALTEGDRLSALTALRSCRTRCGDFIFNTRRYRHQEVCRDTQQCHILVFTCVE